MAELVVKKKVIEKVTLTGLDREIPADKNVQRELGLAAHYVMERLEFRGDREGEMILKEILTEVKTAMGVRAPRSPKDEDGPQPVGKKKAGKKDAPKKKASKKKAGKKRGKKAADSGDQEETASTEVEADDTNPEEGEDDGEGSTTDEQEGGDDSTFPDGDSNGDASDDDGGDSGDDDGEGSEESSGEEAPVEAASEEARRSGPQLADPFADDN